MPLARHWPRSLCPSNISFQPNIPSASGGVSMGGEEQITFSSAGRWKASFSLYNHFRRDTAKLLDARGMVAFLKGRTNRVYIGPYDHGKSPGAIAGGYSTNTVSGIPHGDGSFFSDGSGYSQGRTFATLAFAVAMGDLSARIEMPDGIEPRPGQYFGVGDSQLYLIDGAELNETTGFWEITFWPTMREDVRAYSELNFDNPTCEMRLASDDGGGVTVDRYIVSGHQLELVEAL